MQGGTKESVTESSRTYKPAQVRLPPSAVTLQVCQYRNQLPAHAAWQLHWPPLVALLQQPVDCHHL